MSRKTITTVIFWVVIVVLIFLLIRGYIHLLQPYL